MNKEHKLANYVFANKTNLNQCLNTIKMRIFQLKAYK